jgi:hypothetical protein
MGGWTEDSEKIQGCGQVLELEGLTRDVGWAYFVVLRVLESSWEILDPPVNHPQHLNHSGIGGTFKLC